MKTDPDFLADAAAGGALADAQAVAALEETVIPWQGKPHGSPPHRLREAAEANPLDAAESLLRRSARPGASGAGDGGTTAEFTRQGEQLLGWAKKAGRLITREIEERLVALGGVEHEVFHDEGTGRWLKITMPGRSGKELHAREESGFGVRPTLVTEDALPSAYLQRLRLANRFLGDHFWLHGVMLHPDGLRIVVSQPHIIGEPGAPAEIALHFRAAGYAQVNAKTYYHPGKNLLISDAHTANVFKTREVDLPFWMVPFDVCVQQPRDALRRAVEPSQVLSFDEMREDQSTLTFEGE